MPPAVVLCLESHRPGVEAIANEADTLRDALTSRGVAAELLYRTTGSTRRSRFLPDLARMALRHRVGGRLSGRIAHCFGLGSNLFLHLLLPDDSKKILTLITTGGAERRLGHIRKFEHVVVETEADRRRLLELGLTAERIHVIHPCARFPIKRSDDVRTPDPTRPLRLLFTSVPFQSGEIEGRGIELLLEAVAAADGRLHGTLLCRSDEVYAALRARVDADDRLADRIALRSGRRDVARELEVADAAVIPYLRPYKSFPNSIVDALSTGTPVVVTRPVAAASLIESEACGVVVEPEVGALLAGIEQVRALHEQLSQNAVRCAERHLTPELFVEQYVELYARYVDIAPDQTNG
jgi:glycosyltransferase involved in cell wall biosynthesis